MRTASVQRRSPTRTILSRICRRAITPCSIPTAQTSVRASGSSSPLRARAVSEAPVLILDEATSSVDTRTEKLIEKGLDGLMAGRTVFVIAHRLSTVRNANAILVLEQGRVIERGSHADLLDQHGKYYQLYTNMIELA